MEWVIKESTYKNITVTFPEGDRHLHIKMPLLFTTRVMAVAEIHMYWSTTVGWEPNIIIDWMEMLYSETLLEVTKKVLLSTFKILFMIKETLLHTWTGNQRQERIKTSNMQKFKKI